MIERLATNLDALARLSPAELTTERGRCIAADCALAGRDEPVGVLGWRPGANGTVELKKVYLRRSARGLASGESPWSVLSIARERWARARLCSRRHTR